MWKYLKRSNKQAMRFQFRISLRSEGVASRISGHYVTWNRRQSPVSCLLRKEGFLSIDVRIWILSEYWSKGLSAHKFHLCKRKYWTINSSKCKCQPVVRLEPVHSSSLCLNVPKGFFHNWEQKCQNILTWRFIVDESPLKLCGTSLIPGFCWPKMATEKSAAKKFLLDTNSSKVL